MTPEYRAKLRARILSQCSPSDEGCWQWAGYMRGEYGGICVSSKNTLAHRASYIAFNGDISRGMCVLHKCDNKLCVNPSHLTLGSKADNNIDMVAKARNVRGEKQWNSRLTASDALAIFRDARAASEIANDYAISQRTVTDIKRGISWRHVTGASPKPYPCRPVRAYEEYSRAS